MSEELKDLARQVQSMRQLQREYFHLAAVVRKTNHPDRIRDKKKKLEESKAQERKVDQMCKVILNGTSDEPKLFE